MGDEYARMLAGCVTQCDHQAELETLRGIAKRLADGWVPRSDDTGEYWQRWGSTAGRMVSEDPMTPAEVQAIYGTEESEDE